MDRVLPTLSDDGTAEEHAGLDHGRQYGGMQLQMAIVHTEAERLCIATEARQREIEL